MALSKAAREEIKLWPDVTIAAFIRHYSPDGIWHGDSCGCPDDRCKDGYHHEPNEECHCLPVAIGEVQRALARRQA